MRCPRVRFIRTKRVGYCWIGRCLIISGSAENRSNSCHLSDQPTPAPASLLRSWPLGPSCISSTPQLKREWSPWAKIRLDAFITGFFPLRRKTVVRPPRHTGLVDGSTRLRLHRIVGTRDLLRCLQVRQVVRQKLYPETHARTKDESKVSGKGIPRHFQCKKCPF
jgi:hypothetical protein